MFSLAMSTVRGLTEVLVRAPGRFTLDTGHDVEPIK